MLVQYSSVLTVATSKVGQAPGGFILQFRLVDSAADLQELGHEASIDSFTEWRVLLE